MIESNLLFVPVAILMAVLLYFFRIMALKCGLVDKPNARKIHLKAVPIVGGLAFYSVAASLIVIVETDVFIWYLMMAVTAVVIVGLLDDIYSLSASWRFLIQILASIFIIYLTGVKLNTFGHLLLPNWDLQLGLMAVPITIFGVVGVINALNMADGIDGLAAMTFFCPVATLIFLAGDSPLTAWLSLLLVCVLIFVLFNKSQSQKVFLGDNGSLFLGFILAWLLVYYSQTPIKQMLVIQPVTALYLVGLPIFDTIFVMLRRIMNGVSPFKPDKTHLHHMFLNCGLSQTVTLVLMIILQLILIAIGVFLLSIKCPEYLQFYGFVVFSAVYYILMNKIWKKHHHCN